MVMKIFNKITAKLVKENIIYIRWFFFVNKERRKSITMLLFLLKLYGHKPGELGLSDIKGGVWKPGMIENTIKPVLVKNQNFPEFGKYSVLRGGSWASKPERTLVAALQG